MAESELRRTEEAQEAYTSRVSLEFFRHGKKEKAQPGQSDKEVSLTDEGKEEARASAKTEDISQAVAFGSGFLRAEQQAAYRMAGKAKPLTGKETPTELKKIIDGELKFGTKVANDERLGFNIDKNTPYGKAAYEAFGGGKWMEFLIDKSDQIARECGDGESSTYSSMAAGVAKIVDKYGKIAPRFDSLVREKGYNDEMKRFFGSHQGVLESFLAKVIEKTKGREELVQFVKAVNNQGFGFGVGFKIEIVNQEDEAPVIKISYEKQGESPDSSFAFNEEISRSLIKNIIDEGSKEK
jgi:hypothetical protein